MIQKKSHHNPGLKMEKAILFLYHIKSGGHIAKQAERLCSQQGVPAYLGTGFFSLTLRQSLPFGPVVESSRIKEETKVEQPGLKASSFFRKVLVEVHMRKRRPGCKWHPYMLEPGWNLPSTNDKRTALTKL